MRSPRWQREVWLIALSVLLMAGLAGMGMAAEISPVEITEEEQEKTEEITLEAPNTEEFIVQKLPYGVTVLLEPDRPIRRPWSKSFTFDIDRDWEDDSTHATTGFWFGNGVTSYWITYSRNLHTEDPGRTSFSFSYAF